MARIIRVMSSSLVVLHGAAEPMLDLPNRRLDMRADDAVIRGREDGVVVLGPGLLDLVSEGFTEPRGVVHGGLAVGVDG